ncbi:hypothetical protein GCM10027566_11550 [Arachidicoccus ginsenosidivorans]|jgi:hypothetical protein|uniref:Uncharacterized protein n=1 Tax=Arachidicoccus ginsenosidivorans TaxID=496057 RepID=A0A5B8VGV0_9BACT|nr:hypothetical protein [Arachidicoccus ginsenosidivorans]QEC70509.1 hypothetical protein FSB73_01090 [Arachidicoccus ginsenosidivorans]
MKNKFKILGLMCMALLAISVFTISCSKDDDPADNDFFIGTYNGDISYQGDGQTITDDDGKLTVVKVGSSYSFKFGSGIPDINNVKFEKKDDNTYVSIGSGVTGITITASTLKMLVSNDDGTWTADCSR